MVSITAYRKFNLDEFVANFFLDNLGILVFDLKGSGGCYDVNKIEGTPILKLAMVKDKKFVQKIKIRRKNEKIHGKISSKKFVNSSKKFHRY